MVVTIQFLSTAITPLCATNMVLIMCGVMEGDPVVVVTVA